MNKELLQNVELLWILNRKGVKNIQMNKNVFVYNLDKSVGCH